MPNEKRYDFDDIRKRKGYTAKKEAFAQKFVECNNNSEAYRHAYNAENMKNNTIWKRANELTTDRYVSGRVKELRQQHAERHNVTVDSLTTELNEAMSLAKDAEQLNVLVSAIMGKAKLHGLLIDKKNLDLNVSYTRYLDGLDDE